MKMVLKDDAKTKFLQQVNLAASHIVANFTTIMATMTVQIFATYAYYGQRRCLQRCLKRLPDIKIRVFTTRLIQLTTYLLYFPSDHSGQLVTSLSEDET